ncbi:hypothetical protein [Chitinophaga nivalis]|uniref:CopG family transcriptional regulator n=1 Tax=Chitinophaga nivalis TaxID=2991709 RepID=A0ABT3IIM4_9BACT|nr:hypothetical protein [Chitinophaga nivalis]MCW3466501.1 hypothetical protein [Chitinophaga nivalis]MCW3483808.1 hypothetical protein [Chitinophaga nivalis]
MSKKRAILLPNVPDDIYDIIKEEQKKREIECDCKKSMEKIVYSIIRKHKNVNVNTKD